MVNGVLHFAFVFELDLGLKRGIYLLLGCNTVFFLTSKLDVMPVLNV